MVSDIELLTEIYQQMTGCDHSKRVKSGNPQYPWKCARCGYLYNKVEITPTPSQTSRAPSGQPIGGKL